MIDRVTLAEFSDRDLSPLEQHVIGHGSNIDRTNPENMRAIYDQLSEESKYRGEIYRGIGMLPTMSKMLFENERFRTVNMSFDIPVESWSRDINFALYRAYYMLDREEGKSLDEPRNVDPVGVVLKSHTDKQDVVFDLNPKTYEEMLERSDESGRKFLQRDIRDFLDEKEVMTRNTGGKPYNLCEDVVQVIIEGRRFFSRQYEHAVEAFMARLDPVAKRTLESRLNTRHYSYHKEFIVLNCDGQGNLSIYQDPYKKLF